MDESDIDYRSLFDLLPSYITIHDSSFRIVQANHAFLRDFGPLIGLPCYEAYKGKKAKCEECIVERTFNDGKMHTQEETLLTTNEGKIYAISHSAPIQTRDGKVLRVVKISSSIEETKMLQKQLELSRQEYKTLFNNVPCFISVQDRDFRIIRTNSLFEKEFGRGIGRHCFEVYKRRVTKCPECSVERTFHDGKIHSSEETVLRSSGEEIQMIVYTAPIMEVSGEISAVMEMATDITEVKRLNRELAMLGATLAGTAHTIRNILNGLEGGAYVVQSGLKRRDHLLAEQGWKMVRENVDLVAHLVKDILYCSKERQPEYQKANLNEIVRQVHALYEKKARDLGIELEIDLHEEIDDALLDRMGIHSILTNLVTNAIDACSSDKAKSGHQIIIRTRSTGEGVVLEVSDNGIGMTEEIKEKVFTGFFSTKGGSGTGLGLLKTEKVVRENRGTLSVESQSGKGTTIRIELPRHPPEIELSPSESQEIRQMAQPLKGKR